MLNHTSVIESVCEQLLNCNRENASNLLNKEYQFQPPKPHLRAYSDLKKLQIFKRDGFIDRYSGEKLIFPPVLRIISRDLSSDFPYQQNWKMTETHQAYWELTPTLDHVIPISRGGEDNDGNIVTTSMLRNSAKLNWTLEELGWKCFEPGDYSKWDGLLSWFKKYMDKNQVLLTDSYFGHWYKIA